MYCNKCGQMIPDGSVFCNSCGAKQVQPTSAHARPIPTPQQPVETPPQQPQQPEKETMPPYYHLLSWLTFIFLLIGGISQLNSNHDILIYRGIIKMLAACIFIPQISVGSKEKPIVVYAVKWIVYILVIIIM
ncbi:zinc ribbon domain-containing protein [Ruminococcus flavefaciens]|uniref:zinc ribbon domain-containing protein n=1 Tax=Ruminococcus flavefaciens TaxID=1265 RepID=UPI0026F19FD8|nr:zinc ribbon domain-containing protein [Ruminococcus flavefaciens]